MKSNTHAELRTNTQQLQHADTESRDKLPGQTHTPHRPPSKPSFRPWPRPKPISIPIPIPIPSSEHRPQLPDWLHLEPTLTGKSFVREPSSVFVTKEADAQRRCNTWGSLALWLQVWASTVGITWVTPQTSILWRHKDGMDGWVVSWNVSEVTS